jgi:hypothetical protein
MQWQKIAQYNDDKGLNFKDTIAEANKRKLRIPNTLELDVRLQGEEWKKEKEMYPCRTGTMISYMAPGEALGKTIEFCGLKLQVPEEFRENREQAIVCNHPDFLLKDGTIILGKSAKCVPFPEEDGWYLQDKDFGIPGVQKSSDNRQGRYLWRRSESYIGLVARRCVRWGDDDRRGVSCRVGPGVRLGVFGVEGKYTIPKHTHIWDTCGCGAKKI